MTTQTRAAVEELVSHLGSWQRGAIAWNPTVWGLTTKQAAHLQPVRVASPPAALRHYAIRAITEDPW